MPYLLRLKRARRAGIVIAGAVAFAAVPAVAQAAAVNLGTASSFAVLGGSTVTNTGPSVLNGDLGVSPGTAVVGFGLPAVVNGATHVNDAVASQAQSDLTTAYNVAAGEAVTANLTGQDLGGLTLTAGAYSFATSAQLTGQLTLDAAGDPNAQFVFEIGSTLTTASASSVIMVNGASPCNVYWQVGSSATLGTTTAFQGNVMALTSITLNTGATVQGRVLARNGAVTLDQNVINASPCAPSSSLTPTPVPTSGMNSPPLATPGAPARRQPATRTGTASIAQTPGSSGRSTGRRITEREICISGFTATVRGRQIKRVLFTIAGEKLASRTRSPFRVFVAVGRRGSVKARVTFKDATRPKTLTLAYRPCASAAAVLRPRFGPSQFTG